MTGWTDAQQSLVHQKDCYACQWLDNADMHTYAQFDQNILCGLRVMNSFTNGLTDRQTDSHSDYSAHLRDVQLQKISN